MMGPASVVVAHEADPRTIAVFVALFALVTVLGFVAASWRPGDLQLLDEWGLAGRRFGPLVTWFLLGGTIFTAYTYIAVPAAVYGGGPRAFFALPYTIIVFPLILVVVPRLWSVCHLHGYVTVADFVRGRYGSQSLALVVALTGLLATTAYIALQLVGIQVVIGAMGIQGDWPLVIAFAIVAAYTYHSGLRAPALIAIVKGTLIFVTVVVVVAYVTSRLHGFGAVFDAAGHRLAARHGSTDEVAALLPLSAHDQQAYATLALGSAFALILYPHVLTSVTSASSAKVIRANAVALPIYSLLLGLIALLGYLALAAGIDVRANNDAVPDLILHFVPGAGAGFGLAAIAIGALVPAMVMSIAAANLFTRNIYKQYLRPDASEQQESQTARLASLVVKAGAIVFVVLAPTKDAIDLQLLGGVWILQTLPAVLVGLYTRRLHSRALLAGWAAGMVAGTAMAASNGFATPVYELRVAGVDLASYEGLLALALNLVVAVGGTLLLRALGRRDDADETAAADDVEPDLTAPRRQSV